MGKIYGGSSHFAHVAGAIEKGRGIAQVLALHDRPVNCADVFLAFFGLADFFRDGESGRLAGDWAVIWRNAKWSKEGDRRYHLAAELGARTAILVHSPGRKQV